MQICLVSLDYKPYRSSGLTIYAEDLARGLTEQGHKVTVLAAQRQDLPSHHFEDKVEVYRVRPGGLDWISYSLQAARLLEQLQQENGFQIVHFLDIHFAYAYRGPFVGSVWQSFRQRLTANHGKPYHTGGIDALRRQTYYHLARRFMEIPSLARAGRLIASCESTRNEFINHYHVPIQRIDLAVQGINTDLFRPQPVEALRRRLGLQGKKVILFAGFITPRKGLEYLARAMRDLPDDVHLLIIGRWAPHYRALVLKALGDAVGRLHEAGFIADEERPYYYSLADVYVSPSILEGLGITPIEAMACGTPAIVTSATSGPEEVGKDGLIVPPQDPKALASAIRRLLEHDELRQQLGQRGRERVLENFSYLRMTELTQKTYEQFIES